MASNRISNIIDGFAESAEHANCDDKKTSRLWGSARLTYTICAFLSMVIQLCLRNTLNFVILCMVKQDQQNYGDPIRGTSSAGNNQSHFQTDDNQCGPIDLGNASSVERTGDILWSRSQEFAITGTFYYGYLITLPIAGRLADKFGGKLLFIHSITAQAIVFMLMPYFAKISFTGAMVIRTLQGLIAGCGNPALYQLFSIWAHPTERTAFLSFAYGGYSLGILIIFPLSSFLCKLGWPIAFYSVGGISLVFGICCHWLVYNTLEEHPRISKEEYDYLKESFAEKTDTGVPWRSIFTSVPVYAFIFTHVFHTYGVMVFSLLIPRFFKEAMRLPLDQVGLMSSMPFVGAFISKVISITSCSAIEKRPNLNLTCFRRITYLLCNCATAGCILAIVLATCKQKTLVVIFTMCIGATMDMGFAGVYWPSLLYVAPSYAGLICGIANCLATISGFLAPFFISLIVQKGTKTEWNLVMYTLIAAYMLAGVIYGLFGSSKLQKWDRKTDIMEMKITTSDLNANNNEDEN